MSPKEAVEAARLRLPIIYDGMEFERITEVGVRYDEKGRSKPFIQLLARRGVIYANPERCVLKGAEPQKED